MEKYLIEIKKTLNIIFENYKTKISNPGVLLSGGIDSSTITALVNKNFDKFTILSFGTKNTKDKKFIEIMCKFLNKEFVWIEIEKNDLEKNIEKVKKILIKNKIDSGKMQTSLALGYFLIFQKAAELGIKQIITGQGPDIIMAGYNKYKNISIEKINEEIKKDLPLLEIDGKRDNAMASFFNIKLFNPYLEKEFVDLAINIPAEFKLKNNIEKFILREFAKTLDVPEEIIARPKKAFQYSTGIQNLVEKIIQ